MHRREGTRAYFKAQTQSPVFRDLQQLFEKTAGLAPILEQILNRLRTRFRVLLSMALWHEAGNIR